MSNNPSMVAMTFATSNFGALGCLHLNEMLRSGSNIFEMCQIIQLSRLCISVKCLSSYTTTSR